MYWKKDATYEAARQEEKGKPVEKINGCSEAGHADCWCDRGRCWDRMRWRQMIRCSNSKRSKTTGFPLSGLCLNNFYVMINNYNN